MVSPSTTYSRMPSIECCSLQATDTGTRSKVTLTNWVRSNNAPLLLPRPSAVQWNEYVFVLAKDGTTLLHNSKHGIWSMLPVCSYAPTNPPTAVNYKGLVITMTTNPQGQLMAFDVATSRWRERPDLNKGLNSEQYYTVCLTAENDKLYMLKATKYVQGGVWEPGPIKLFGLGNEGWKLEAELPCNKTSTSVKLLILRQQYIIQTSYGEVYKRPRAPQQTNEDNTQIAPPPYTDSTLHVVKDMLFAFGGRDEDNQPTSDVLRYNPDTDSWESAGYMRVARYNVAVVTIQLDSDLDVMAIGGSFGSSQYVMTQRVTRATPQTQAGGFWEASTSITEKCVVE